VLNSRSAGGLPKQRVVRLVVGKGMNCGPRSFGRGGIAGRGAEGKKYLDLLEEEVLQEEAQRGRNLVSRAELFLCASVIRNLRRCF
jgi:hypothetical protein